MTDPRTQFISVVKALLAQKEASLATRPDCETMELDIIGLDMDSLEKMELFMKIEDTFKVMLDEGEVLECRKIQDLFALVRSAI